MKKKFSLDVISKRFEFRSRAVQKCSFRQCWQIVCMFFCSSRHYLASQENATNQLGFRSSVWTWTTKNEILYSSSLFLSRSKLRWCCHDAQSYGLSFFVVELHLLIKYFKNFSQTHTFLKMRHSGTQDFDRWESWTLG